MTTRLDGVHVRFGDVVALDGVDLALGGGEVHVLVGPNGAGKSTLLGVLLGLVRPQQGQLLFDGQRIDLARKGTPYALRERIGYLPESVAFAETLTGREVLGFFARARGVARNRVDASLERVGLATAARRAVRGYSRGMRQRLGLAIALVSEPQLLVLDEPTGGLDQEGLSLLWSVLAEWKAAGRSVVLSTHDLALIERRADQLSVLSGGRVIALGSPQALRERVALPLTLRFTLDDAQAARGLAERIRLRVGGPVVVDGALVAVAVEHSELVPVVQAFESETDHLVSTRVEEPGLDDVYERLLEEASS